MAWHKPVKLIRDRGRGLCLCWPGFVRVCSHFDDILQFPFSKNRLPFPHDDDECLRFVAGVGSDDRDITFGLSLPPALLLWSLELASVDGGWAAFDLFSKDWPNFRNFCLASVTCPWPLKPSSGSVLITGSESPLFPLTLRIFSLRSWWENPSPYFNWGIRRESKVLVSEPWWDWL